MIAKSVFAYLEPYLPYQLVYGISMVAFFLEKFVVPKVYQVYSNASLDPKSLIPFVIAAIALYLSIVSIYHAFRAAFRMVWFLVKWSMLIVFAWLVLAFVNDFRDRSDGGHKIGRELLQNYQDSLLSWWHSSAGWSAINLTDQLGFDPLQVVFGHGLLSFLEPLYNQDPHRAPPSFNSQRRPSASSTRDTFDQSKSRKKPPPDSRFNVPKLVHQFWVHSVQTPIQAIIKQSQSKYQANPATEPRTR